MKIIGIDIGGTTIKADLYDDFGTSLNQFKEIETIIDYDLGTNQILNQVCDLIGEYVLNYSIDGVGISTAGVVNANTGEIIYAGYTIPGYIGVNFTSEIEKRFGLSTFVENDVNCAALGELWKGQAKDKKNVVMVTIGTGIGGSIIVNGQIVNGFNYTAGEVGYIPVGNSDWQSKASTTALIHLYQKKSLKTNQTGRTFFTDLSSGDKVAKETFEIFVENLTKGLLTISYLLNPEILILGGGILAKKDILLPEIQSSLAKNAMDNRFLPKNVVAATLGNEAGRIGAVKNFLDRISNK
ncbi:TPA: ROK family protein [Streptococcus pneumoniae]|uniref:ROK family protein n=1 Tax=Streptococcus pseudopneumoniae TaxID=257758 RepID=UPI0010D533D2|nr:ROK family protein [Streptococcus pseudopneumoniae]MDG8359121.1 ROK family protein [Streptococcus pneumoniae]NIB63450.1 ROK family protein [Streptococcus pseudopneumoniae]VPK25524.1 transcriptional regulator [Streptococcus pneumoniae]VPX06493.1 transcriptional regulator [Streptococcus pneumoniae]VQG37101.1 transcriptional regulator [Streptococcus pneumoniae]